MVKITLPLLAILSLVLTACDLNIIPVTQKVGPLVSDPINVPLMSDSNQTVDIYLKFGAGSLKLHPGSDEIVTGIATYNVSDFKPTVVVAASSVRIEQGNWKLTGIPDLTNIKNEWDLALGNIPMSLTINAGAYQADYELGSLALVNLSISDGAAESKVTFSSPNPAEMSLLSYTTGASNVSLIGLGNANFTRLEFNSGAGNYSLDFSGNLTRDASIHIGTGISNLTLVIPSGIPSQVTVKGGLSNVSHDAQWNQDGNIYSQNGTGPHLTIVVEIGAGNLTITR